MMERQFLTLNRQNEILNITIHLILKQGIRNILRNKVITSTRCVMLKARIQKKSQDDVSSREGKVK
jgi:hypothetical protein